MTWEVILVILLGTVAWGLLDRHSASPRLPAPPRGEPGDAGAADFWAAEPAPAERGGRPAPLPEDVNGPAVVSLEPLDVRPPAYDVEPNRAAEHRRFHRGVAPTPSEVQDTAGPLPRLDAAELRRAVLLAEVLGPPRSLRPLGDGDR